LLHAGAAVESVAMLGFAAAYVRLYRASDRERVGFHGPLLGVAAGLLGVGLGLSFAVGPVTATPTPTETPTENATASAPITPTPTPENESVSLGEFVALLERGSWSQQQARDVYRWVQNNNLSTLREAHARKLLTRLLERSARADVPTDVLREATVRLGSESSTVARSVARNVSTDAAAESARLLDRAGEWADPLATEMIQRSVSDATVQTATPEPTPSAIASNDSTIYADLGTVEVVDWPPNEDTVTTFANSPVVAPISAAPLHTHFPASEIMGILVR
jgi:hypothetical protein